MQLFHDAAALPGAREPFLRSASGNDAALMRDVICSSTTPAPSRCSTAVWRSPPSSVRGGLHRRWRANRSGRSDSAPPREGGMAITTSACATTSAASPIRSCRRVDLRRGAAVRQRAAPSPAQSLGHRQALRRRYAAGRHRCFAMGTSSVALTHTVVRAVLRRPIGFEPSASSAAVEYAHRHMVVHRDLKPSNIQIDGRAREAARLRHLASYRSGRRRRRRNARRAAVLAPAYASRTDSRRSRTEQTDVRSALSCELLTGGRRSTFRLGCGRPTSAARGRPTPRRSLRGDTDCVTGLSASAWATSTSWC